MVNIYQCHPGYAYSSSADTCVCRAAEGFFDVLRCTDNKYFYVQVCVHVCVCVHSCVGGCVGVYGCGHLKYLPCHFNWKTVTYVCSCLVVALYMFSAWFKSHL